MNANPHIGPATAAIIGAILHRRSVSPKYLALPGPSVEDIREIVRAACAAPDHGHLGPARFVFIPDDKRLALADIFEAAAIEADPACGAAKLAVARERALHGPCLLAVTVTIDYAHVAVPAHEQWISAGAAMQNALLAAEALGFRAKIVSGARTRSQTLRSAFKLPENEHLACFIAIGSTREPIKEKPRRNPDQVLTVWPG